jgi:hypothetical protein
MGRAASVSAGLDGYLNGAAARGFDWRGHDCCQFLRGWIVTRRGVDAAAGIEPYSGEREALLLVHRHGGLEALLTRLAASAGLSGADRPLRGDVGLVAVEGPAGATVAGGIYTGRRWAVLQRAGLAFLDVAALKVWRV